MFAHQTTLSPQALDAWLDTLAAEQIPKQRQRQRWRRSSRGNLTTWRDGHHLTVFQRNGCWSWSITNQETDEVRYSPHGYPSEDAAADAVLAEVR